MNYIFCILIGYVLGCINPAYIVSRLKGFDIRSKGSNNAGASNAMITMGWGAGVFVALFDIAKACCSVLIATALFPEHAYAGYVAGVASVLGHIFPFYMKFKGGKGLASYMGLLLALNWKFFLVAAVAIALITLITDYIAIGTLTVVVAFPIFCYFTHVVWIAVGIICIASATVIFKHIVNIKKIIKGEEIGLRKANQKNK